MPFNNKKLYLQSQMITFTNNDGQKFVSREDKTQALQHYNVLGYIERKEFLLLLQRLLDVWKGMMIISPTNPGTTGILF